MKIGVYSGPNNDGERDLYGTIESLPDGSIVCTGDDSRMKWLGKESELEYLAVNNGKQPTADELLAYILASDHTGRIKKE